MAKAHMTPFQEAAFIPFEIVFLHEALERGSGPLVYTAVVLAGLLYARYLGGIFAECYDSFPPERRNARSRVPLVAALIVLPLAADQLGKMLLGLALALYRNGFDFFQRFVQ